MTERMEFLRRFFIEERAHRSHRSDPMDVYTLATEFAHQGMSPMQRTVTRLIFMLEQQRPLIFPEQTILFARSLPNVPALFTPAEKQKIENKFRLHESGELSNICVDYSRFLNKGVPGMRLHIDTQRKRFEEQHMTEQANYLSGQLQILDALRGLILRYQHEAICVGNNQSADSLDRLLQGPPKSLRDALQLLRILHFTMWCSGSYHNTLGRFDQYILPFLQYDLDSGILTQAKALEIIEEFFLSCNIDSDLYPGIQQGDNGQSLVLGGLTPQGKNGFNLLSRLCLQASLELRLIDPKINLRVNKDTPLETYIMGTELTKQGLGFPQYSNDDVIVPGLQKLGYKPEDARDYSVAACWEFIIPGSGMEVPNIDALCFASIVRSTILQELRQAESFDDLFASVELNIQAEVDRLCRGTNNLYIFPAPFASLMMEGCVEQGKDVSLGCVYNNYGFHGTGLSTAVDSLAAVKHFIYDNNTIEKDELLHAIENDFIGHDQLLHILRYNGPKMGNNESLPDDIACRLLETFSAALKGRANDRGGIFRAGTGSAMYYLWHSRDLGATPDGRRANEAFAANYSPSLFTRPHGPVSVIKSFTKPVLQDVPNGGPLTIELSDTLFRNEESVAKVAALVKSYIDLGGHQIQINAVNRDTMLDAQKHPERHHNLIVRVWGWSGYFVELDKVYQDHIIERMEHMV